MANLWHQRFLASLLPPQRRQFLPSDSRQDPRPDTLSTLKHTLTISLPPLTALFLLPVPLLLYFYWGQWAEAICGLLWQPHVNTHHCHWRLPKPAEWAQVTATIVNCTVLDLFTLIEWDCVFLLNQMYWGDVLVRWKRRLTSLDPNFNCALGLTEFEFTLLTITTLSGCLLCTPI